MAVTKPYKIIGLGAMEVTKPYKFIGFEGWPRNPEVQRARTVVHEGEHQSKSTCDPDRIHRRAPWSRTWGGTRRKPSHDFEWIESRWRSPTPIKFIGFGVLEVTKPYKFIGFGALEVPKPYKFIGFGALEVPK